MTQDLKERVELLPCPFCKETQICLTEWPADTTIWEVFCLSCKVNTGAKFTKEEAIKHWNTRVLTERESKLVEALQRCIETDAYNRREYDKVLDSKGSVGFLLNITGGSIAKKTLKELGIKQ